MLCKINHLKFHSDSSLPHRQLRNQYCHGLLMSVRSLPHRQL